MKLTETDILFIKTSFDKLRDKNDFLALLNYVKPIIYGDKTFVFKLKDLNYHINYKNPDRYISFKIPKKSGKERVIFSPNNVLKSFQKCLNVIFHVIYKCHPAATGFTKGKSIVTNAKVHVGSNYVYNLDLKDFFPSIDQARFWARLQFAPFNLNQENSNLKIANIIAFLCCHEITLTQSVDGRRKQVKKHVLPQGAPTSPIISNIICQRLDFYLSAAARKFGAKYSRYADDITFSSIHNIYNDENEFIIEVRRIIKAENFQINKSKVRLQENFYKQVVTGLVVNENVNVTKKYIKELRMWLFFWEVHGLTKANQKFLDYRRSQGIKRGRLIEVLKGKLDFLRMVKGENNLAYSKLKDRFNKQILANNALTVNKINSSKSATFTISDFNLKNRPELHDPQKLVKLLNNFTSGSSLKYATHSWEQNDTYSDFIIKISRDWRKIENEMFALKKSLATKIDMFLDSGSVEENGWGSTFKNERIYYGWKGKSLQKWCENNENVSPFYFPIPSDRAIEFDGIKTNYFYNVAEIFKRQIEIREENNHLHNMFLDARKKILGYDFIMELINTKGITFFTDVNSLKNGLVKIFEGMRKRPQHPAIKIVVESAHGFVSIKITHVGSICNRSVDDPKILFNNTGDFADLKKNFTNLCDWSIESKFNDGLYYKINYLTSSNKIDKIERLANCDGFTYILKFYT